VDHADSISECAHQTDWGELFSGCGFSTTICELRKNSILYTSELLVAFFNVIMSTKKSGALIIKPKSYYDYQNDELPTLFYYIITWMADNWYAFYYFNTYVFNIIICF